MYIEVYRCKILDVCCLFDCCSKAKPKFFLLHRDMFFFFFARRASKANNFCITRLQ